MHSPSNTSHTFDKIWIFNEIRCKAQKCVSSRDWSVNWCQNPHVIDGNVLSWQKKLSNRKERCVIYPQNWHWYGVFNLVKGAWFCTNRNQIKISWIFKLIAIYRRERNENWCSFIHEKWPKYVVGISLKQKR